MAKLEGRAAQVASEVAAKVAGQAKLQTELAAVEAEAGVLRHAIDTTLAQ